MAAKRKKPKAAKVSAVKKIPVDATRATLAIEGFKAGKRKS
jgi:hypothetical protein